MIHSIVHPVIWLTRSLSAGYRWNGRHWFSSSVSFPVSRVYLRRPAGQSHLDSAASVIPNIPLLRTTSLVVSAGFFSFLRSYPDISGRYTESDAFRLGRIDIISNKRHSQPLPVGDDALDWEHRAFFNFPDISGHIRTFDPFRPLWLRTPPVRAV